MNTVTLPKAAAASSGHLLYFTIFMLSYVDFLQFGMTAFAAAPIMGGVGITPEDFSLVAAAYAALAILMISMQRWLVERFGGRLYIQGSLAVLMVGDVLTATSGDFTTFLLGRLVMAVGGGGLFTSSRMIVQHCLAGPKRFGGIKAIATSVSLGISTAPWLATVMVSNGTWNEIYWVLAPVTAVALVLASLALPKEALLPPGRQLAELDPWQQVLLIGGSFMLLYALQRLYYDYYSERAWMLMLLGVSVVALLAYARHQRKAERPLLALRHMMRPRYVTGILFFMVGYMMLGANNYVIPVMLQQTMDYSWETVGYFQTLGFLFAMATWLVMSRFLPRRPAPQKFFAAGFLALAAFGWSMSRLTPTADLWLDILPGLALYSVFLLTVLPTAAMQTFRELEFDEAVFANGQQLKNMLAQAGIALGITLATLGQQWRTAVHYTVLSAWITPGNPHYVDTVRHLQAAVSGSFGADSAPRAATAIVARLVSQQATMLANIDYFHALMLLGLTGIVVTLAQRVLR